MGFSGDQGDQGGSRITIEFTRPGKATNRWLEYPPFLIGNTSHLQSGAPHFPATASC